MTYLFCLALHSQNVWCFWLISLFDVRGWLHSLQLISSRCNALHFGPVELALLLHYRCWGCIPISGCLKQLFTHNVIPRLCWMFDSGCLKGALKVVPKENALLAYRSISLHKADLTGNKVTGIIGNHRNWNYIFYPHCWGGERSMEKSHSSKRTHSMWSKSDG